MTRSCHRIILILSLTLNLAVFGTVAYLIYRDGHVPGYSHVSGFSSPKAKPYLSDYLDLSDEKRRIWEERREGYKQELAATWQQIRMHREKMIRAIFVSQPDLQAIEAERAEIARLQESIQRALIRHLLQEQELLDDRQRQKLAELLLQQDYHPAMEGLSQQYPHKD
jgi:Spy/CpxP family protein refolding chaperone